MLLWPRSAPQLSKVPNYTITVDGEEFSDNCILQCTPLAQSNLIILLTKLRVLVYNLKPLALVACHERNETSLKDFGANKAVRLTQAIRQPVDGLISEEECNYLSWHHGKIVLYVSTSRNYVLSYQILRNANQDTVNKEYGIAHTGPTSKIPRDLDDDQDFNRDDDALVVFDKNKYNRVLQNGYIINKDKGLLHMLTSANDDIEELPVRKLDLRLKIVLKFEFEILDLLAYKTHPDIEDGSIEDNLIISFPHGLQSLVLTNFKLRKTSLLDTYRHNTLLVVDHKLIALAYNEEENKTYIDLVDISKQCVERNEIAHVGKLVTAFELNNSLVLVYKQRIIYYNCTALKIEHTIEVPLDIKACREMNTFVLMIISEQNSINLYSKFGNCLLTIPIDDIYKAVPTEFEYTDFCYADKMAICCSRDGEYQVWKFWEGNQTSISDLRQPTDHIYNDNNNNIMICTQPDTSNPEILPFYTVKIPSRSLNNQISMIRLNSSRKMLAVYIENKEILMIHNLDTNLWFTFTKVKILSLYWIGNSYLVFHLVTEEEEELIQCARLPLDNLKHEHLAEYVVWTYEVPRNFKVLNIHCNSLYHFRALKLKKRVEESETKNRNSSLTEPAKVGLYKTAEIIIVLENQILSFDVLTQLHASGVHIIRTFHQHLQIGLPSTMYLNKITWIMTYNDGFLFLSSSNLYKVERSGSQGVQLNQIMNDVEMLLDAVHDNVFFVQNKTLIHTTFERLWKTKPPYLSLPIEEEFYPIFVNSEIASVYGLHCYLNSMAAHFSIKSQIYLDEVINFDLAHDTDIELVADRLLKSKHYKFALEKSLSYRLLYNKPLTDITKLIRICDLRISGSNELFLEIVSNCLRKVETVYWNKLFQAFEIKPQELLRLCLENHDAQKLGILLIVFLNYEFTAKELEAELEPEPCTVPNAESENSRIAGKRDSQLQSTFCDEDLMLQVLKLLVNNAATDTDNSKAAEAWDMCFQLARFLKNIDKEYHTNMFDRALQILDDLS